ncbi:MAG: IS21-like element helper ATPase IstB [Actinomycetota bacterium]
MSASAYQQLRSHLAYLGLSTASERLAHHLDAGGSATEIIEALLGEEVAETKRRKLASRLRFGHYPLRKTLSEFDFSFQPSIDRKVIGELSTLRFVEEKRNVLLLGPPGVGKSHLAIGLGIAATEAGYRTYFTSAQDLVRSLQTAHLEGRWGSKMRCYTGPSVLVIDELGYLPMDQSSAHWIFEVVTRRYERGSIVLTSNRGFAEWGQVFADAVVASAILDRLLHHATVVNVKGKSFRMRSHESGLEDETRVEPVGEHFGADQFGPLRGSQEPVLGARGQKKGVRP